MRSLDSIAESWTFVDATNNKIGPFAFNDVVELWKEGTVKEKSMVWSWDMNQWIQVEKLDPLMSKLMKELHDEVEYDDTILPPPPDTVEDESESYPIVETMLERSIQQSRSFATVMDGSRTFIDTTVASSTRLPSSSSSSSNRKWEESDYAWSSTSNSNDIVNTGGVTSREGKMTKINYWVEHRYVDEVIKLIESNLSLDESLSCSETSKLSHIYFDNKNSMLYHNKLKHPNEATLYRIQWENQDYNDLAQPVSVLFQCIDGYGIKDEFQVKGKHMKRFLKGEPNALKKYPTVAATISQIYRDNKLKPCIRNKFHRKVYNKSESPVPGGVTITVDNNLSSTREAVLDDEWITPTSALTLSQVIRSPWAVVTIEIDNSILARPPLWIEKMQNSTYTLRVDAFDMYIHACSLLCYSTIRYIPHWHEQYLDNMIARGSPIELPEVSEKKIVIFNGGIKNRELTNVVDNRHTGQSNDNISFRYGCFPYLNQIDPNSDIPIEFFRMKIEPKTFFSNERVFLQYTSASIVLASIGVALTQLNDDGTLNTQSNEISQLTLGFIFIISAIMILTYALIMYQLRLSNLVLRRPSIVFADRCGPLLVTITMFIAFVFSIMIGAPVTKNPIDQSGAIPPPPGV